MDTVNRQHSGPHQIHYRTAAISPAEFFSNSQHAQYISIHSYSFLTTIANFNSNFAAINIQNHGNKSQNFDKIQYINRCSDFIIEQRTQKNIIHVDL